MPVHEFRLRKSQMPGQTRDVFFVQQHVPFPATAIAAAPAVSETFRYGCSHYCSDRLRCDAAVAADGDLAFELGGRDRARVAGRAWKFEIIRV